MFFHEFATSCRNGSSLYALKSQPVFWHCRLRKEEEKRRAEEERVRRLEEEKVRAEERKKEEEEQARKAEEEREKLELEEQQKRAELQKEASHSPYFIHIIQIAEADQAQYRVIDYMSNYSEKRRKQRLRRRQRSNDRKESASCNRISKSAWRGRR